MWSWIWLAFCGVIACDAQAIPVFTLNPQGGVYGLRTTVTLRCSTSGSVSNLVWIQNDLVTSPPVIGGTLTIVSLSASQSGSYRCLAVGTGGVNVTSSVALVQIVDIQGDPIYSTDQNSPTVLTVNRSQPFVTRPCGNFNSASAITYSWTLATGGQIPPSHQVASLLNGSLLLQYPSASNDGQTYKCIATATAPSGGQQTKDGYLSISVSQDPGPVTPLLISQPQSLVVNPGDTAKFLCVSAGGSSPPTVVWTYPSNSNAQTNSYLYATHVDVVVTRVNAGNQGNYTCTSQNVASYSSTLTIRGPPVIDAANSLSLAPVSYLYGVTFTLSCNAMGNELTWLWYHNGMRLGASGSTLVVPSPTLDDSGTYQCFAYNPYSNVSAIGNITIQTLPATFTNGTTLSNTLAFIGQQFALTCKARGAPAPTYHWYKDDIVLSSQPSYSVNGTAGILTINSVSTAFSGKYTCVATNSVQSRILGSVSSSASLMFIEPTVIMQSLPANISIQVGDTVTLPCLATSSAPNTQLTYNWTKDSSPLNMVAGLSYTGMGGSIAISSVRMTDAGLYRCTVYTLLLNNSLYPPISLETDYSRIMVTDAPVSPIITSITVLNGTSIKVTWTYSGLPAKLSSFLIQVMSLGATTWTNSSTFSPIAVTMAIVGSLMPFTVCRVQVVAVLNDGTYVASKVSTIMTLEAIPSEAPSGLVATPIGASELQLTWKAPSKAGSNGILTDYCVQYREQGSYGPYTELYVGSNNTMYLLTGLKPLFSYEVRVAANTSVGRGPFTSVTITTAYSLENTSFTKTVGFIAMLVGIGLCIVTLSMGALVVVMWRRHHRTKIYRVKSGTFMSTEDVHLERDIIHDYEMRGQKFHRLHVQQQQQQSGTETDGASCSESVHTNQTGGSSSYMLPAPAYINPPSFEEYTKRSRAVYSASRDRLNEDPAHQDNAVKEPGGGGGFHVRTRSQSSLKQQFEPQENGYTHSQSSLKHQFEQQETEFQIRTVSQSGSKQHFDHESDEDVSIEKPSLSSTPSEQEFHVQLEGKMAQAIATGTFV